MSDFTIEISDDTNILEIETSVMDVVNNIEIESTSVQTIDIITGYSASVVYASDIIGLDNYLSNFIDTYNIDCGSP
jgi:uncharacterized protein YjbK